jgi:glycosyltransferase involved in cell wall biosynthesis
MQQKLISQDVTNTIQLSVCVIGRNEGNHLPACISSLRRLAALEIGYETIFVDSASTDDSPIIAQSGFDQVLCLAQSPFLNAGAARHVATQYAKGNWVLYLDGDMELAPEILPAIDNLISSGRTDDGLCGFTENVYPDGSRDLIRFRGNKEGTKCRMFGGAVLLPRLKVLEAGNWSCALYAYEESELYSRLLRCGVNVLWYDHRMVEHKTPAVSLNRKFWGAIIPFRSYLGKKFYGAGQVTRFTLRNGNFRDFVRLKPDAYLMLASVFVAIAAAPWLSWTAGLVPSLTFLVFTLRQGIRCAVNYTCWLVQLAFGFWRLNPDYHPTVDQILTRKELVAINRDCIG